MQFYPLSSKYWRMRGLAFEDIDEEEFMNLMGDILADQIDEQLETGRVQFA